MNRRPVTREEADRIFQTLLGRPLDPQDFPEGRDPVSFALEVACSDEARARVLAAARAGQRYWVSPAGAHDVITATADAMIGETIRRQGRFAEDDIAFVCSALAAGEQARGGVFLDIGANIGSNTLYALANGFKRALAVEPDPENLRILRANLALAGFDDRAVVVGAALSDRDGEALLERSPANFGDHRVAPDETDGAHGEASWERIAVPLRRLDSVMAAAGIAPDDVGLAWIDTQGHEAQVLAGASDLLAARAPVVAEFWPYGLVRSGGWAALLAMLDRLERPLFDLRESVAAGALVETTAERLAAMRGPALAAEGPGGSPHTDVLILP
ncbi:MAG: FkbM family methyltransferase [Pseudomonadota bacterium]